MRSKDDIQYRRFSRRRRAVVAAVASGRRKAPIHGLFDVDVTDVRERLAASDGRLSLTAHVVACVGRAAAANPEVHAYRDWRRRLVLHSTVDVATMFEIPTPDGPVPVAHVLRDAHVRTTDDLSAEIRAVQADPRRSPAGRILTGRVVTWLALPLFGRAFYWLLDRSVRMRTMSGTVSVTSIGMYGGGGGFGIPFPTAMTISVLVGGVSEKPVVRDGEVVVREMLDLTVTADHRLVDGAPVARFVKHLRTLLEDPATATGGDRNVVEQIGVETTDGGAAARVLAD